MEDPSSFDDARLEVPATPQPRHAELPAQAEIPRASSPTTSLLVGNSSSPAQSLDRDLTEAQSDATKYKYTSPPPSSMTPPPSTQPPTRHVPMSPNGRVSGSLLSSPPQTVQNGVRKEVEVGVAGTYAPPSEEQILDSSVHELRDLLKTALLEVTRLDLDAREARMSAVHYKLQHNLLSIETQEATKRMEVEHEMTRREVDALQAADQARQNERSSEYHSASSRYVMDLKAYLNSMEKENSMLKRRLQKAKKIISQKEDETNMYMEENHNLLRRIRENREHLNRLRSPGGIFAAATSRAAPNHGFASTPQQYRGTPKQTPRSARHGQSESQNLTFDALLLADKVLNDNPNSAPSTPTHSRPPPKNIIRHSRAVQSLSSLPSTPIRSQPMTNSGNLLPSVQFAPQSEPRYRTQYYEPAPRQDRNRKSRDSTISASDAEEIAREVANYETEDEEIQESQASQSATEMLRQDPRESMEVVASPDPSTTAETSNRLQAKIFGPLTKPGVEKRKRSADYSGSAGYAAKKQRMAAEALGLGISTWGSGM